MFWSTKKDTKKNSKFGKPLLAHDYHSERTPEADPKSSDTSTVAQEISISIPLAIENKQENAHQQTYLDNFLKFCQFIPELKSQHFGWTHDFILFQPGPEFSVRPDRDNPGRSMLIYNNEYHVLSFNQETGQIFNSHDASQDRQRYFSNRGQDSQLHNCQRMYLALDCMDLYDKTKVDINDVRTDVLKPYRAWVEQMQHPTLQASVEQKSCL